MKKTKKKCSLKNNKAIAQLRGSKDNMIKGHITFTELKTNMKMVIT